MKRGSKHNKQTFFWTKNISKIRVKDDICVKGTPQRGCHIRRPYIIRRPFHYSSDRTFVAYDKEGTGHIATILQRFIFL